jgi:hypothetical protein
MIKGHVLISLLSLLIESVDSMIEESSKVIVRGSMEGKRSAFLIYSSNSQGQPPSWRWQLPIQRSVYMYAVLGPLFFVHIPV